MNVHWQMTLCVLKSTLNDICILFYLHNVLYFCKSEGLEELVASDKNECNLGQDMFLFGKLCTNESNTIASGTCICCINMHLLFRLSDVVISSRMYLQSHHVILIMSIATFVSFADSKPKTLPREHIDRYKRGDTHPVSALYQLSQVLQFQLDMKETVTTSKWYPSWFYVMHCPVHSCIQVFFPLCLSSRNNRVLLCVLCCDWWSPV